MYRMDMLNRSCSFWGTSNKYSDCDLGGQKEKEERFCLAFGDDNKKSKIVGGG